MRRMPNPGWVDETAGIPARQAIRDGLTRAVGKVRRSVEDTIG